MDAEKGRPGMTGVPREDAYLERGYCGVREAHTPSR